MAPDDKYCDHHFDFVKHLGVMERALTDIDSKINKLFELMDIIRGETSFVHRETFGIKEGIKAYGIGIAQFIALAAIAVKMIWG